MKNIKLPVLSLLLLLTLSWVTGSYAQEDSHFPPPVRTDASMPILVQEATLDGDPLVEGDEIGVFTPGNVCAGMVILEGEIDPEDNDTHVGFAAWQDDPDDEDNVYFEDADELSFRVWDAAAEEEWIADESEHVAGPESFNSATWVPFVTKLAAERQFEPILGLDRNRIDFGNIVDNEEEFAEETLTITNDGGGTLTIDSLMVDGDVFTTDFEEVVELEADDDFVLTVTFAPEEEGVYEGMITIYSNDEDSPHEVDLFARWEEPRPIISLDGVGIEGSDGDYWYEFQNTLTGTGRELIMFVHNDGDETLTVLDMSIEGDDVFSVTFDGEFDVVAGERQLVVVAFDPVQVGVYEANLVIESNDDVIGDVTLNLTGEAIPLGGDPVMVMDHEHFFNAINLGEDASWRLMVTNDGGSDLWITDVSVEGSEEFETDFMGEERLRPGDMMNITVTYYSDEQEMLDKAMILVTGTDPEFEDPEMEGEFLPDTCWVAAAVRELPDTHFQYFNTDLSHTMLVEETTLDNEDMLEGDEIGIFTMDGLCAGGGVIEEDGRAGIAAFSDGDPDDHVTTGFFEEEMFDFVVWDADANREYPADAVWSEGPETFEAQGFSVLNLEASSLGVRFEFPNIVLSAYEKNFGQVLAEDMTRDWMFSIQNNGMDDLSVSSIISDMADYIVDPMDEIEFPAIVGAGGRLDVMVTFDPEDEDEKIGRLTINSDDPDDASVYVDLYGVGVDRLTDPWLEISEQWVYFGVQDAGFDLDPAMMVVEIMNGGGGELVIDGMDIDGAEEFSTDFEADWTINAGESQELTISFNPELEGQYDAMWTISSNDEINVDLPFWARGYGSADMDQFKHLETESMHEIAIDRAYLVFPDDSEADLVENDEIGAFVESGLCVGHLIVPEEGDLVLMIYGDDPSTNFIDGALAGEIIDFDFFDNSIPEFLDEVILDPADDIVFEIDGMNQVEMWAASDNIEPNIAVVNEMMRYDFGPVNTEDTQSVIFEITNDGGGELTIEDAFSDIEEFWIEFDFELEDPVVLLADEVFELEVFFSPSGSQGYMGEISVVSDDPDEIDLILEVGGTGSTLEGYFQRYRGDGSHILLITEVWIGDALATVGDEVGAFTTDGFCAGVGTVDADGSAGLGAFPDVGDTWIIEGFEADEDIYFRVYDASRDREYMEDEIEANVEFGSLLFERDGETFLESLIVVGDGEEDIWSIGVDGMQDPEEDPYYEGDLVEFEVFVTDPPVDLTLELENAEDLPEAMEWEDNGDNTLSFSWQTGVLDAGEYDLIFYAYNDEVDPMEEDRLMVKLTIVNVNASPRWDEEVADGIFAWDEDLETYTFTIEEDAGWTRVVEDLTVLWTDLDEDDLIFWDDGEVDGVDQLTNQDEGEEPHPGINSYWVFAPENWFGSVELTITADDLQNDEAGMRDDRGPVRLVRRAGNDVDADSRIINRDAPVRSIRTAGNVVTNRWLNPRRDAQTDSTYTLIVTPVNDAPMILDVEPGDIEEDMVDYAIDEADQLAVVITGDDVDSDAADVTWEFGENTNLPDDTYGLEATGDYEAEFTFNPTHDHAGEYVAEIILNDNNEDENMTDVVTFNITVRNVNLEPIVIPPMNNDTTFAEDDGLAALWDLNEIFVDPDDDVLVFDFVGDPDENLNASIVNGVFSINPTGNFHSDSMALDITVNATDGEFDVEQDFIVRIYSMNDGPDAFNLVSPLDLSQYPEGADPINFGWDASTQLGGHAINDWEADVVTYTFWFACTNVEVFPDPISMDMEEATAYENIETSWFVDQLKLAHEVEIFDHDMDMEFEWWVVAADMEEELECNNRFHFTLGALIVRDIYGAEIPDVHFLTPNFPNPFNATTTVRFGLPVPGDVDVSVWDMHGRKVATLVNGNFQAGRFEAVWDGNGVTSGVYLIRMQSGQFNGLRKAILIK